MTFLWRQWVFLDNTHDMRYYTIAIVKRQCCMNRNQINSKSVGWRNEKMVLALLKEHGTMSQSRICELTRLGSSTVSTIVSRLREKNLITEIPGQSGKRGAKPVLISMNPIGQYILGVEVNPNTIRIGLFDFHCDLTDQIAIPLGSDHSVENVIRLLEINIKGLISKEGIVPEKVMGIGVTLSGSVTPEGIVELSSPLGWKMVPLKRLLAERFEWPIKLYTTRVRLLAEIRAEPALSSKNIFYFNIADGVGSTILIDGHLIHGATNRCGELGHLIVQPDGPPCGCGHNGCLEAFISGPAIAQKIRSEIAGGIETCLAEWIRQDTIPDEIMELLSRAADQHDPYALSVRDFIAEHLCWAASMAINLFDPDVMILAGYVSQPFLSYLIKKIRDQFADRVYDPSSRDMEIIGARGGRQALIRGVAAAVFQDVICPV